jgi:plasmid maintenance system antidote protein VapI
MKQKELAKALGVKPQYVNALMNGRRRPSPDLAERLELITGICRTVWVWGSNDEKKRSLRDVRGYAKKAR